MDNRNETMPNAGENGARAGVPVVPLPNPGEGGPVYPGDDDLASQPAIPLPTPEQTFPVYPGDDDLANQPAVPLPTPEQTFPVYPGPSPSIIIQPLPSTTVTVPTRYAAVRFLNATYAYPPFRIFIDGTRVVNLLRSGTASGYVRIPAGNRTITVAGQDGYIYLEDVLPFASGSTSTVAIVNRAGGLALTRINDACRVI